MFIFAKADFSARDYLNEMQASHLSMRHHNQNSSLTYKAEVVEVKDEFSLFIFMYLGVGGQRKKKKPGAIITVAHSNIQCDEIKLRPLAVTQPKCTRTDYNILALAVAHLTVNKSPPTPAPAPAAGKGFMSFLCVEIFQPPVNSQIHQSRHIAAHCQRWRR